MAKRSRKRVRRKVAKHSWFGKFFTFPKLALYFFAVLSAFTIYQVTRPETNVLGIADDDIKFVTKAEQDAIIKESMAKKEKPTFHQIAVFEDTKPQNAKRDSNEYCLGKVVTFTVSSGSTTRERTRWGCDDPIKIYSKSRTVTITLKSISNYKFSGLTYSDNYYTNRTRGNGAHSIKVTGFPSGYPATAYFTVIDFGVKPK
ncbi:MAG: hypothetical protein HY426_02515 [Candidatus Levybacteria bacterium]|nr:hypothetical protein [Candidatus Levybacteria bacterium]